MNKDELNISESEAKSALDAINKVEQDTNKALRMPIWLNIIISAAYGMGIFSWASTRHENLWMLGVIVSTVVFFLGVGFYLYSSRLLGVKPKLIATKKSEWKFGMMTAIGFAALIMLTREISKTDLWWVAYLGAGIGAFALAYLMHFYPSGDTASGKHKNV